MYFYFEDNDYTKGLHCEYCHNECDKPLECRGTISLVPDGIFKCTDCGEYFIVYDGRTFMETS